MKIFYYNDIKNKNKIRRDNCRHSWSYTDFFGGVSYRRICSKCDKRQYRKFNRELHGDMNNKDLEWVDELDNN